MKVIRIINKLADDGSLKTLMRAGIVSPKIYMQRNVFLEYDKNVKTGMKPKESVEKCADDFKVSERTIFRAIKIMKQ